MPKQTTKEVHVTMSPSKDNYDSFYKSTIKSSLEDFLESDRQGISEYMWILEFGRTGTHAHWHIYCKLEDPIRPDKFRDKIKRLYPKEYNFGKDSRNRIVEIKTTNVHDRVTLLGWYFQKDKDRKVIGSKNINLKEFKETHDKNQLSTKALAIDNLPRKYYTLNQLPDVYLSYCNSKGLPYNQYSKNFEYMFKEGFITVQQLRKLDIVTKAIKILTCPDDQIDGKFLEGIISNEQFM